MKRITDLEPGDVFLWQEDKRNFPRRYIVREVFFDDGMMKVQHLDSGKYFYTSKDRLKRSIVCKYIHTASRWKQYTMGIISFWGMFRFR